MAAKKVVETVVEEEGSTEEAPQAPAPTEPVAVEEEPEVLTPAYRKARVKGTWLQVWGTNRYNFVDNHTYEIPHDLFEYLRRSGNIYDTLA